MQKSLIQKYIGNIEALSLADLKRSINSLKNLMKVSDYQTFSEINAILPILTEIEKERITREAESSISHSNPELLSTVARAAVGTVKTAFVLSAEFINLQRNLREFAKASIKNGSLMVINGRGEVKKAEDIDFAKSKEDEELHFVGEAAPKMVAGMKKLAEELKKCNIPAMYYSESKSKRSEVIPQESVTEKSDTKEAIIVAVPENHKKGFNFLNATVDDFKELLQSFENTKQSYDRPNYRFVALGFGLNDIGMTNFLARGKGAFQRNEARLFKNPSSTSLGAQAVPFKSRVTSIEQIA